MRGAIRAVRADDLLRQVLSSPDPALGAAIERDDRPYHLIAAGKAAEPMARAWVRHSRGVCRGGLVVAPSATSVTAAGLSALAAGHPVPTVASLEAGERATTLARTAGADDRLIVLLSGGASSLVVLPAPPVTLDDKVGINTALLRSGASIDEINAVRKHLSLVKGGQLAVAAVSEVWTFALSDVVAPLEDDPSVIGSGPTVADPTTYADALDVLERSDASTAAPAVRRRLEAGHRGEVADTPKPGDPRLARSHWWLIGSRRDAMAAAAAIAADLGYAPVVIDAAVTGESRIAGPRLLAAARARASGAARPCCVIASGETTVRVRGRGRGGRNQEMVLSIVAALEASQEGITFASVGTDGRDGPTDAAGAIADGRTLQRARDAGLGEPQTWLADNNAYAFFDALGDLVRTGPTGTNVADLQVFVIE